MKKLITMLMATIMMFALATTAWAAGETADDPVQITTAQELNNFLTNTTEAYGQLSDDLTEALVYDTDTYGVMEITIDKDLDLNDKTIQIPNDVETKDAPILIKSALDFTMHNGTFIAGIDEENTENYNSTQGAKRIISVYYYAEDLVGTLNVNINDMTLKNAYYNQPAIFSYLRGDVNINVEDTDFICAYGNAIVMYFGEATMTDCTVTQTNISSSNAYGSNAVSVAYGGTINIYGGEYNSEYVALYAYTSGGTINVYDDAIITGGTKLCQLDEAPANHNDTTDLDMPYVSDSTLNIYDGTLTGVFSVGGSKTSSDIYGNIIDGYPEVNIYGGTFTADPTDYVADCYSVTEDGGVYTVAFDMSKVAATVTDGDEITGYYSTLADAVAAATDGDTVTLLTDVALDAALTITKSLTLDLGGYTIDADGNDDTGGITVNVGTGTVIIQNGEITRTTAARVIGSTSAQALILKDLTVTGEISTALQLYSGSTLTNPNNVYVEDGCTLTGSGYAIVLFGPTGSIKDSADSPDASLWPALIVNGGEIVCENGPAISGNGSYDYTKITINGGVITGSDLGIYHPQTGNLTITGGTITAPSGIQFCCDGTLTMTGGTIQATAEQMNQPTKDSTDGDGYVSTGSAIVFISRGVQGTGYQNLAEGMYATISGGTLISDNNGAIQVVRMDKDGNYQFDTEITRTVYNWLKELKITGGTFIGATDFAVEALAYYEGVIAITGGSFLVEPDENYIVKNYVANETGDYYVVEVKSDEVAGAVADATDSLTEESTLGDIKTAIEALTDNTSKEALATDDSHVDTVNTVDEMLIAATNADESTGTLEAEVKITALDDDAAEAAAAAVESVTADQLQVSTTADANVQGLALAVVGNEEIAEDTTVTVTLEIAQTAAEVTVVTETDDETGEEVVVSTTIAVTYDISPSKTVDDGTNPATTTTVANDDISAPITFTLHLPSIFDDTNRATLTHDGVDKGTYVVYHDGDDSYITVTTTHFSEFVVTLADNVSTSTGSVKKYSNELEVGDNGSAYATPLSASSGTTVYINVTPDTGYEVDEVIVDGGDITVTDNEDGTYSYTQPSYAVEIEVTFVATDGTVEEEVEEDETEALTDFEDVVAGAWYEEFIAAAVEEGIMQGNSSTEFAPNGTTTRAMMIQVLFNLEDQPETENDESAWYSEALAWGMEFGITDGTDITGNLTREQLVTMLYRYAMSNGVDTSAAGDLTTFGDYETVSDWAADAFAWAVGEGIINGDTDGNLNPDGNATRAELAKIMVSYLGL